MRTVMHGKDKHSRSISGSILDGCTPLRYELPSEHMYLKNCLGDCIFVRDIIFWFFQILTKIVFLNVMIRSPYEPF